MSKVTFKNALVSLASAPTDWVRVPLATLTTTPIRPVTLTDYTNGRRRGIVGPATLITIDAQSTAMAEADSLRLQDWIGAKVLWRDFTGRRLWGLYQQVPTTPVAEHPDLVRISLTINQVTHSELV